MRAYQYTAIIAKNMVIQGKMTFSDNRSGVGKIHIPLDSRLVLGYILGETPTNAEVNAIKRLKQQYPEEQGYIVPTTCRVEAVPEIVIEVVWT